MQSWKDNQGRQWTAYCPINLAIDLKAKGLDLLNPDQLAAVYADPIEFLKLGARMHQAQMEELAISELDMLDLMTGSAEVSEDSTKAIEAALLDFFHRVRGGKAMAAVLHRAAEAAQKTEVAQVAMINGVKGDKAIQQLVAKTTKPLSDKLAELGSLEDPGEASGPPLAS
jgi:hypothetical protein